MNVNNHILDLIKIGLTRSESKVYFNLLKKKDFTATEIAKVAHVPRPKVYDILRRLVEKGFCTETFGKIRRYSAVNPYVCFDDLFVQLEEKKRIISYLRENLLPLYISNREKTDPLNYIQIFRKRNVIVEKLNSLERKAKEEVICFTKRPYARREGKIEEPLKLVKSGLIVKSIYEVEDALKPNFLKGIEMFAEAGEKQRIAQKLPLKFMVFDNKTVLFSLENRMISETSVTAIIIEHSDLAMTLKGVFDTYWEKAMTLEEFKIKFMGVYQ